MADFHFHNIFRPTYIYMDSIHNPTRTAESEAKMINTLLKALWGECFPKEEKNGFDDIQYCQPSYPQQLAGSNDCGLFAILGAIKLLSVRTILI